MNEALNYRRIEFGVTRSISRDCKENEWATRNDSIQHDRSTISLKNFDLSKTLRDYLLQFTSYTSLRDGEKQTIRLNMFESLSNPDGTRFRRICQSLNYYQ